MNNTNDTAIALLKARIDSIDNDIPIFLKEGLMGKVASLACERLDLVLAVQHLSEPWTPPAGPIGDTPWTPIELDTSFAEARPAQFKPGDVVTLASDPSVRMTVEKADDTGVSVWWFAGEFYSRALPSAALVHAC